MEKNGTQDRRRKKRYLPLQCPPGLKQVILSRAEPNAEGMQKSTARAGMPAGQQQPIWGILQRESHSHAFRVVLLLDSLSLRFVRLRDQGRLYFLPTHCTCLFARREPFGSVIRDMFGCGSLIVELH